MVFKTKEVAGILPAMEGMRNPKASWHLNDTVWEDGLVPTIGPNDLELARKLISGGEEHAKFMRQIMVWVDITAPIYWWSEFDTYKVGTTRNSCSTMHTLVKEIKGLEEDPEFMAWYHSGSDLKVPECVTSLFELDRDNLPYPAYVATVTEISTAMRAMYGMIRTQRLDSLSTRGLKIVLKRMLPSSWLQKATVSMSYQNVRRAVIQRHNHELKEWSQDFVSWASKLPYARELIFQGMEGAMK